MPGLPHRIALILALAASPACIITGAGTTITSDSDTSTTGGGTCPDPNSFWEGGVCFCNAGYAFCNDNPDDLSCCPVEDSTSAPPTTSVTGPTSGEPTSGSTSTSASTTTGTTEPVSTTDLPSTTGTTTGGMECEGPQLPPDTCEIGQFWCTQPEVCGPQGSELYRCEANGWVLDPNLANDSCKFDGYDFAYGCVDDGNSVVFICGDGPGTDCDVADPTSCFDDKLLAQCIYGKLAHFDCLVQCSEIGDDMMTLYDYGYCGEDMGTSLCLCCDMGEPGCPI